MIRFFFFLMAATVGCFAMPQACVTLIVPGAGSVTPDTRSTADPLVAHAQDSSIPRPTFFSWTASGISHASLFDIFVSEDTVFDTTDFFGKNISDTFFLLWNLKIDTKYYWRVNGHGSGHA
jgi:hypothetical protein